jgi:hypothetical protein
MHYECKMVQIPPTIVVEERKYRGQEAAHYLETLANEHAADGWEFFRIDRVGVILESGCGCAGCLAFLLGFGRKATMIEYYVMTFRRET